LYKGREITKIPTYPMTLTSHALKPFICPFVITLLLISVNRNTFCQDVDNKFYVSLSPCGLIDVLDYPSLRLSVDAKVYKNISLSVENVFFLYRKPYFTNRM
jgi:hypothetical protein